MAHIQLNQDNRCYAERISKLTAYQLKSLLDDDNLSFTQLNLIAEELGSRYSRFRSLTFPL